MVNKVHAFRDRDIKRIVRSVERATGKAARRVEVDPKTGRCSVEVGDMNKPHQVNDLDAWMAKRGKDARPA